MMQLMKLVKITTNYNDSGKVQYLLSNSDALIDSTDYTADVCFNVAVPADSYGCLVKQITESTSTRALIEDSGEEYDDDEWQSYSKYLIAPEYHSEYECSSKADD